MKTFHKWISEARKKKEEKLSDEELTRRYNELSSDAHVEKMKRRNQDLTNIQHQRTTSARRPTNEGYLRIQERGRTEKSINKQYSTTVEPMHNQFVEPSKYYADLIIQGTEDNNKNIRLIKSKINSIS